MGWINQERSEAAKAVHVSGIANAATAVPPTAPDTSINNYTCTTKADNDP